MKVLILSQVPDSSRDRILACFPPDWNVSVVSPDTAAEELSTADALIPEHTRVDRRLLDCAPQLRFIQTGAGWDNVDTAACAERHITVCNAAGINARAVAEHVMAYILCWNKNLLRLDSYMKSAADQTVPDYSGSELFGKTVGIIGLGAIGKNTARLCRAFGMKVLVFSRTPSAVDGVEFTDPDTLCGQSDIVTVHVPLTASTYHMIDLHFFEKMKPGALFINTSRGSVVNESHLIEALDRRLIAGACLDVFETEPLPAGSPLRSMPNVILTPHTAGLPDGVNFHEKRCRFYAENIEKFFSGQRPDNIVTG